MQTDEYSISLSREVAVCESMIRKVRRLLAELERRHGYTTEEFIEKARSGMTDSQQPDFLRWSELADRLLTWTGKREEYVSLLLKMKH